MPIESARRLASQMHQRWGLEPGPVAIDFAGGLCATLLDGRPGEVEAPAGDAHILSVIQGEDVRHRQWQDGKPVVDKPVSLGMISIVRAGRSPRAVLSQPMKVAHVYLPHARLVVEAEQVGPFDGKHLEIIDPQFHVDEPLVRIVDAMNSSLRIGDWRDRLWLDSIGAALMARILQRWSNLPDASGRASDFAKGGLPTSLLERVCSRMVDSLPSTLSLVELADGCGLSAAHFCRAFSRSLGKPPHRWLLEQRVARAQALLRDHRLSMADVGALVGYDDPAYFARVFKRATGLTPLAYRRQVLS